MRAVLGWLGEVLGAARDAEVARAREAADESGFTYGRLHALEQLRADRLEAQLPAAWKQLSAPRRRRRLY